MGGSIGKGKKQSRCLCVGLDNSGKSTILNYFKPKNKKATEMFPTVGFGEEKFEYGAVSFAVYDMSGHSRYRNLWDSQYSDTQAIIYVIDSSDIVRMCVVKDELENLLAHKDIEKRAIPILVYSNKMDLAKALTPAQISETLDLPKLITAQPWTIVASNALTGQGLDEGIKWLSQHLP